MNNKLIFLEPVFKEMIWGGSELRDKFGYNIPSDSTGECWAISAHPNGDCKVLTDEYTGKTLSELWNEAPGLFGNFNSDRFPLLIKILDAKDDLSVQVHPDDAYAGINENGSLGKTECWYILDCKENATIVIGHNAKDKKELADMINEGRWNEFIREVPIKKGDFFQINPGCLHAIKGGTLILETQQNSDITYRVYDYGRLQNGKPRDLHVKQSIDVITAPFVPSSNNMKAYQKDGACITKLIECDYYTVEKLDIKENAVIENPYSFMNVSVIDGEGSADGIKIKKGSHFIIPNGYERLEFNGNFSIIVSYVK